MCSPLPVAAAAAWEAPVPPGFRLEGSNGYKIHGIGFDDPEGKRDELLLFVGRKHSGVLYAAPAEVTETSIVADLGAVGSVDVAFVPSGGTHRERSLCDKHSIPVQSGSYEGSIDLSGEEGYMHVQANRAPAELRTAISLACGGSESEGFGGHSPGARLTIRRRSGEMAVELTARKNSPTRVSRFSASIRELRGGVQIFRGVDLAAPSSAFFFDVPAGSARIGPPAPFSGVATYHRDRPSLPRLRGNLKIDFPGRSDVRLIGPGATAGLIRAVQNPGHPFRALKLAALLLPKSK